jgi:RNA polymerase sigma-70 factor (ECF subfamily)
MDGQSAAVPQRGPDPLRLTAQYGWVRAVARNLVRDPWGAEDVTQETLLAALAAPPREVPDDQRLRAWLGRVAFNLSRLGERQGARRRAREVRVARREALPSVTEELESAGTIQALSLAIADLPEPHRRVVLMRYFDGLSTAEIAEYTSTSELAVHRKRLWRARAALRARRSITIR